MCAFMIVGCVGLVKCTAKVKKLKSSNIIYCLIFNLQEMKSDHSNDQKCCLPVTMPAFTCALIFFKSEPSTIGENQFSSFLFILLFIQIQG